MWRPGPDGPEVVLVHRQRYNDWSLPKGKLDAGEHAIAGAVREIAEETGLRVRLGRPLPTLYYEAFGRPKEVRYWAARALDGEFVPSDEVDELAWVPVGKAPERLTRALDADVVHAFAEGPANTAPLIVLRHGATVPRNEWSGPDADRPCNTRGLRQAQDLVPLLEAYGPRRLLSSDSVRCVQTLEPYAAVAGAKIRRKHGLSEEAGRGEAARARAKVLGLASENTDGVVCTHRPVLPPLFEALAEATGAPVPGSPLRKGEFVVLHLFGGRAVATERHRR